MHPQDKVFLLILLIYLSGGILTWLLLRFMTVSGLTDVFRGGEEILAAVWPLSLFLLASAAILEPLRQIVEPLRQIVDDWGMRARPWVQNWKESRRKDKGPDSRLRYLLVPGWVRSQDDTQGHWVSGDRLARLYGVPPLECMTWEVDIAGSESSQSLVVERADAFAQKHNLRLLRPDPSWQYRLKPLGPANTSPQEK